MRSDLLRVVTFGVRLRFLHRRRPQKCHRMSRVQQAVCMSMKTMKFLSYASSLPIQMHFLVYSDNIYVSEQYSISMGRRDGNNSNLMLLDLT